MTLFAYNAYECKHSTPHKQKDPSALGGQVFFGLSGWGDSNSRPPRPERGALTWLRYIPSLRKIQISKDKIQRNVEFGIVMQK